MASDLAEPQGAPSTAVAIAEGRQDWSHWANTLGESLPGEAARSLVRGVQTGTLEEMRAGLSDKQQTAVEYGVGALVGGATRFVFGREIVEASHAAFAPPPDAFPAYLEVPAYEPPPVRGNKAAAALDEAARSFGDGVASRASAFGGGATAFADTVSRPFRSVDRDGDDIPDDPQAVAAARELGNAVGAGAASAAGAVRRMFRGGESRDETPSDASAPKERPRGFGPKSNLFKRNVDGE